MGVEGEGRGGGLGRVEVVGGLFEGVVVGFGACGGVCGGQGCRRAGKRERAVRSPTKVVCEGVDEGGEEELCLGVCDVRDVMFCCGKPANRG